jgi:hypothetical protein
MLVQDSQTGYFHEMPDHNVPGYDGYGGYGGYGGYTGYAGYAGHGGYGGYAGHAGHGGHGGIGKVLYDGLGNPVGMLGGFWDVIKGVASNIPIVGGLVSNLIPGSSPPPPTPALPFPGSQLSPNLSNLVSSVFPGGSQFPTAPPAPWPYRWIRPQGPLMAGHRRMYLRCTAWPGPEGLVPVDATTTGLLPPQPGAPMPGTPAGPVFHRRRHRRRR